MKTKLTIVAAGALALLAFVNPWGVVPAKPGPDVPANPVIPLVAHEDAGAAPDDSGSQLVREEVTVPPPAVAGPTTGALAVRVIYGTDDAALADVGVRVLDNAAVDRQYGSVLAHTDAEGRATFPSLSPGPCSVWTNRARARTPYHRAEVVAGATAELVIRLEPGIDIEGIVVDADGVGVAGAEVHLATTFSLSGDVDPVTSTDANGRFLLRGCGLMCMIGARAFGHTQARMRLVMARVGATVSVRLELGPAGGAVSGQVVDGDGVSVARAVVRVGAGSRYRAAQTRTDGEGAFLAVGVPPGEHPVAVRARGYGVWTGTCAVSANATTPLHVTLLPGVTCAGTITGADGSPAAGARVHAGKHDTLTWFETRTDVSGAYRLEDLPAGELAIAAGLPKGGKAAAELHGASGQTLRWDARLSTGTPLVGRVVFESGEPVRGASVTAFCRLGGNRWLGHATAGKDGRFEIDNCPDGGKLHVEVLGAEIWRAKVADVDPLAGELVVQVRRVAARSVTITGTVLGPDGKPCGDAMVFAVSRPGPNSGFEPCDKATGRFKIGPLRPGEHVLYVRSENYPKFGSELKRLAAHEIWDLGVVRLVEGGRVRVELTGTRSAGIDMVVWDATGGYVCRIVSGAGAKVSAPLVPGHYRLSVSGVDIAARAVPFEVRASATTRLAVKLVAGYPRRIEVASPFDDDLTRSVQFVVRTSAGEIALQRSRGVRGNGTVTVGCGFAPGEYTVSVTCEGRRGTARFRVDAKAGTTTPIRVQIK